MALSTENANLVWQKVEIAKQSLEVNRAVDMSLRGLKAYLAQEKRNIDLQFVPISDLGADTAIADAACKIYAIVLKKGATSTGAFFKAADHATVSGTTASDLVQELNASEQQVAFIYANGWAQGTGFAVGSDTTADGSTASTSGDGPNGFVILGAA